MNIEKMSEKGAVETIKEICNGLKHFASNNPHCAKEILVQLEQEFLEPLAEDDFFGTEGWENGLNVDI